MSRGVVWRCSRCSREYVEPPPPACSSCCSGLWRVPDGWGGVDLERGPRTPRVLSAGTLRARRWARRRAGDLLRSIVGVDQVPASLSLLLYGPPGAGKSSLSLRLCEDSPPTWERPLYAAIEEGLGPGLADRIGRVEATRSRYCDARDLPELAAAVDAEEPDVLVVDSVTAAGLAPEDALSLRRTYPALSLILVSQVTKSGDHVGSRAWTHDVDLAIELPAYGEYAVRKSWIGEQRSGRYE